MCGKLVFFLCAAFLYCCGHSVGNVDREADECTSSFISMDRIEAAVKGEPTSTNLSPTLPAISRQAILPYINFTCDGSILSWTFGAQWEGNSPRYTELQIWRSSGDRSYTKVGSTTVILEEENSTQLYQYTLTSPLPFQAGDILGYFQGNQFTSQLRLLFEDVGSNQLVLLNIQDSPSSQFTIGNDVQVYHDYHLLISVETNPAGCDCGFMSVERMKILLGLETIGDRMFTPHRQQITPDIKFTCDGLITKWILGANWARNQSYYPELQVWRPSGNNVYHRQNGTVIKVLSRSPTNIYEYDAFSPIPFLAGDVLGVFLPQTQSSMLRLWSEGDSGPAVYYVDTGSATNSPLDAIDLECMTSLSSTSYFPLVTVEIIVTMSASLPPTALPPEPVTTPPMYASTNGADGDTTNDAPLIVGVAVASTLLGLITTAVVIITVLVCLRKKGNKMRTTDNVAYLTDNVAYLTNTTDVRLLPNRVYTAVDDRSPTTHELEYLYVAAANELQTAKGPSNSAKGINTCSNEAYGVPMYSDTQNIPIATNPAYAAADVPTSTNPAYAAADVPTSTNPAYAAADVPTSTNQAYEAVQNQSEDDPLEYY